MHLRLIQFLSLGLNCATGPELMEPHVAWLSENWDGFISVVPNAGLPELVDGCAHFPLSAHAYGTAMKRFVEQYGVHIVSAVVVGQHQSIWLLSLKRNQRSNCKDSNSD